MNKKGVAVLIILLISATITATAGIIYYKTSLAKDIETPTDEGPTEIQTGIKNGPGEVTKVTPVKSCNESDYMCVGNSLFICSENNWTKYSDCKNGCNNITNICIEIKENLDVLGLEDYPEPFIINGGYNSKNRFIVGDKGFATDSVAVSLITGNLQYLSGNNPISPLLFLTSEITPEKITDSNLILIGDPCRNDMVREYLGMVKCEDWSYPAGKSLIKFYEEGGHGVLIVAGKTADDVVKAAKVIANHDQYSLSGSEAIVSGTKDNPTVD